MTFKLLNTQTTTKLAILCLVVVCIFIYPIMVLALDAVYHDLDEIYTELQELQEEFPDWMAVDSVGHSSEYDLPIWMAKVSDNPRNNENEPALLYIGQIHGEEVIGVETTLYLIRYLLENLDEDVFRQRLENLELYFIPTANPEGLRIVHDGDDVTYRKNCRDNVGDGVLRIQDEAGWDTSGVDLNRNFGLHWDRGLDLYEEDDGLIYNYYRGTAPFSESETQMLRELAYQKNFLYSVSYHSSRSGQNSELVIAPWSWDGKYPPDYRAIDALLDTISSQIPLQIADDRFYNPVHSLQRLGQSLDWFYQAVGTFQYIIEIGNEIQPDSAALGELIADQLPAALYLMDIACELQILSGFGLLNFNTFDANSGEPVRATIVNHELNTPILEPRRSTISNGRYDWLLPVRNYDFTISAQGYESVHLEDVEVREGESILTEIELIPLSIGELTVQLVDISDDQPVNGQLSLLQDSKLIGRWEIPREGMHIELPITNYQVEVVKDGYLPIIRELEINVDSIEVDFEMYPAEITYDEQFDNMGDWQHGGEGDAWGIAQYDDRSILTESVDGAYSNNAAPWVLIQTGAGIINNYPSVIRLIHQPYFEPGADSGRVNIWNRDINAWQSRASFSQFPAGWDTTYITCNRLPTGSISVRFQVTTDNAVTEDGWMIDRLTIFRSTVFQEIIGDPILPSDFSMYLYPNPTNGFTSLHLNLTNSAPYNFEIYDVLGRKVTGKTLGNLLAGEHKLSLDAGLFTSGVYFINLGFGYQSHIVKLTVLK